MNFISLMNTPLMAIEILCAELVTCKLLLRRNRFYLRFIFGAALCVIITVWIEILYVISQGNEFIYGGANGTGDSLFKFFYYLAVFAMTVGCCIFSYKSSVSTVMFCCSAGFAAQHLSANLTSFLRFIPYFDNSLGVAAAPEAVYALLEASVCAIIYCLVWLLLVKGKSIDDENGLMKKAIISVMIVVMCVGGSRLMKDNPMRNELSIISETLIMSVSCLLLLYVFSLLVTKEKVQREMEMISLLLHKEREQTKLTKETIELINIKSHDLKHQIALLSGHVGEPEIQQIERLVKFYDNVSKTGNDILDIVLTEKSIYCENNNIRLNLIINGNYLSFMEDADICSLFGNALSNAIGSVEKITDESKRCVNVNVRCSLGMTFIHIENYCGEEVNFENGYPVTSKDKKHHGFGMKSMEFISKKYKGTMTCGVSEGKFILDFSFPNPNSGKT